jgi:hypothetical protein
MLNFAAISPPWIQIQNLTEHAHVDEHFLSLGLLFTISAVA